MRRRGLIVREQPSRTIAPVVFVIQKGILSKSEWEVYSPQHHSTEMTLDTGAKEHLSKVTVTLWPRGTGPDADANA